VRLRFCVCARARVCTCIHMYIQVYTYVYSHIDSMMGSGCMPSHRKRIHHTYLHTHTHRYMPSHRMPYGAMIPGYPPEMYSGAMEDLKGSHSSRHAAMGMSHMASHVHPDMQWMGADPRMSGRGMWQHPAAFRDAMRGMGVPAGRYGRGEGVDTRMLELHGYGFDPSYVGHIGHAAHMVADPRAHEMQMMHGMVGGGGGGVMGGAAGMSGMSAMPRKVAYIHTHTYTQRVSSCSALLFPVWASNIVSHDRCCAKQAQSS
jgi:hypothetical protein